MKGKPYFMSDNTRPDPEILKTRNYAAIPWPISLKLVVKSFPEEGWKFNTSGKRASCKGPCGCQSFGCSPSVTDTVEPHFRSLLEWIKVKCGWGEAITSAWLGKPLLAGGLCLPNCNRWAQGKKKQQLLLTNKIYDMTAGGKLSPRLAEDSGILIIFT